jgi:hypothetical protein
MKRNEKKKRKGKEIIPKRKKMLTLKSIQNHPEIICKKSIFLRKRRKTIT